MLDFYQNGYININNNIVVGVGAAAGGAAGGGRVIKLTTQHLKRITIQSTF